jgi:hypothetical protein
VPSRFLPRPQLEEEAEGNLQQCLLLQAENAKLKAAIAALETETSHREGVLDLVASELAELSDASALLSQLQANLPPAACPRGSSGGTSASGAAAPAARPAQ